MMEYEQPLFTDNVREPVDVLRWFLLLVTWDGILPLLLAATPTLIGIISVSWPLSYTPARSLVLKPVFRPRRICTAPRHCNAPRCVLLILRCWTVVGLAANPTSMSPNNRNLKLGYPGFPNHHAAVP